ncbi:hypothetical protein D6774_02015 [Candidatus Woesearchaeota archaeon]|nr:MAG: hypothetical protein D6774_02015 [Candidatus Woesearchaeota archaeon]
MLTVIIDTNFWLLPFQFHIDIVEEIKKAVSGPCTLSYIDKTIDELEYLIEHGSPTERRAARLGFDILKQSSAIPIKTDKLLNVDQLIVNTVTGPDFAVATQDKELKAKIKAKNGRLIVMRQKKRIELI